MKLFHRYLVVFAILTLLSCQKELSLEFGNYQPVELEMAWEFRDSSKFYKGTFDTAYIQSQGTLQALTLEGRSEDGTGSIFIQMIGDPLQPGIYTADQGTFQYNIDGQFAYGSVFGQGNVFAITVTRFDSLGVQATFSGIVENASGTESVISDGRFSANFIDEGSADRAEAIPDCENIIINGTYVEGEELTADNFLTIPVSVITPGTYSILTETINGFVFFGEGELTERGNAEIILNAIGTPSIAGESLFEIESGPVVCPITINVIATLDSLIDGNAGTLRLQQKVYGDFVEDHMSYYASNNKIGQIDSDVNPMRKIKYNGQNNIDRIEYYSDNGQGNFELTETHKFRYDNNANVTAILNVDDGGNTLDTLMTYSWNADKTLLKRVAYDFGNPQAVYDYQYTNGDLTRINVSNGGATTSVDITYDSRDNMFPDLHPQYYFMDMAIVFDDSNVNEILYNSSHYPLSITYSDGTIIPVDVVINPNRKPVELKFDSEVWFRYFYY